MQRFKGILALDLDGTIAHPDLSPEIVARLNEWMDKGWHVVFITGRIYHFALPILAHVKKTYSIAVQNGAALYRHSFDQVYRKRYLSKKEIPLLDRHFQAQGMGWCLEAGKEDQDRCYYRPDSFRTEEKAYVESRMRHSHAILMPVQAWNEVPLDSFACAKCFGSYEQMQAISRDLPYRVIAIQDPLRSTQYLAHINHPDATKGQVIMDLQEERKIPVIAAGDDYNDASLLAAADIAIAMEHAPPEILALAHIRASIHNNHIVECIQQAMESLQ